MNSESLKGAIASAFRIADAERISVVFDAVTPHANRPWTSGRVKKLSAVVRVTATA